MSSIRNLRLDISHNPLGSLGCDLIAAALPVASKLTCLHANDVSRGPELPALPQESDGGLLAAATPSAVNLLVEGLASKPRLKASVCTLAWALSGMVEWLVSVRVCVWGSMRSCDGGVHAGRNRGGDCEVCSGGDVCSFICT